MLMSVSSGKSYETDPADFSSEVSSPIITGRRIELKVPSRFKVENMIQKARIAEQEKEKEKAKTQLDLDAPQDEEDNNVKSINELDIKKDGALVDQALEEIPQEKFIILPPESGDDVKQEGIPLEKL